MILSKGASKKLLEGSRRFTPHEPNGFLGNNTSDIL
jgi:hypothetical protein